MQPALQPQPHPQRLEAVAHERRVAQAVVECSIDGGAQGG
jgi:hypothetical protein